MAMLNKVKNRIKKLIKNKQPVKSTKRQSLKAKVNKKVAIEAKKESLGSAEVVVEKSKFSYPHDYASGRMMPQELPNFYGKDRIALQVRDPWWLHTYWEVTSATIDGKRNELRGEFDSSRRVLRVYDVSNINFDGNNAHKFFDIEVGPEATSWYIDTSSPGSSWCVDYGLLLANGRFITILRSNTVTTPLAGPSWITDEEWMIPEDMFARLYGMSFGFGRSSPVGKGWHEKIRREFFSSPGVSSMSSAGKNIEKERKFWMMVNTELIVYGATEPDASVFVQDKQINLRHDGTFTLRFALPDGKQVIGVKGISADKQEERVITPIVTRETK